MPDSFCFIRIFCMGKCSTLFPQEFNLWLGIKFIHILMTSIRIKKVMESYVCEFRWGKKKNAIYFSIFTHRFFFCFGLHTYFIKINFRTYLNRTKKIKLILYEIINFFLPLFLFLYTLNKEVTWFDKCLNEIFFCAIL